MALNEFKFSRRSRNRGRTCTFGFSFIRNERTLHRAGSREPTVSSITIGCEKIRRLVRRPRVGRRDRPRRASGKTTRGPESVGAISQGRRAEVFRLCARAAKGAERVYSADVRTRYLSFDHVSARIFITLYFHNKTRLVFYLYEPFSIFPYLL